MINYLEILGLLAGVCTTFSSVPQIRKILKTKSPDDISYLMCIMNCTGFVLWFTYGVYKDSLALIVANIISLAFFSTIIILKYRWDRIPPSA